ncbi:hypothetical protein [Paracoccus sp. (in: a-proteobacteria)]|uniref:hypothetical protein n=1 Tax=Paracoccus sp. TaxID=267 RepID=UPI0026E02873|nr:hypothetical protein [Paracoccus sp. (in: a-proteobacteria)]MDO5648234.1 hypothetical protein [Paracoccus sp. (in: a-proteobacteria)]
MSSRSHPILIAAIALCVSAGLWSVQADEQTPADVPAPRYHIGDLVPQGDLRIIRHPGQYGLSVPPAGNSYAIVQGKLVRVDTETGAILSILRPIRP